jgi:hypothetical protein
MTPPPNPPDPAVYQLKVVLRGVSPMIWRRVLVRSNTTIAGLHRTLQLAMGWSDEHLHRFVIHGKAYGVSRIGGIGFADDPDRVQLADFGFRLRERFLYEYDFRDGWQHDVRVEAIWGADPWRCYPACIGGRRAAPPEDCGGPWAFLELRQRYSLVAVTRRLAEILGDVLVPAQPHCQRCRRAIVEEHRDELTILLHWARAECFDRRQVNWHLRGTAADTLAARRVAR